MVATFKDDGEFAGWWSYGALIGMFTRTRKVAIASLFETVLYLFVPWFYAVGDKTVVHVDGDDEVPPMKDKDIEKVLKTLTKKSLQMIWAASRSNSIKDLKTIPSTIVNEDGTVADANARNQEIFRVFAEERRELQIDIRHDVAVYRKLKGQGKRQRKGTSVRTLTRSITLLDAAAQYMYALCGGERVNAATEVMRFNSSSLVAMYLLALSIRDMLEVARPGCVMKAPDCQTENVRSHGNETIADLNTLFDSLIPNTQLQGRGFNRCVWGVSEEMYELHNRRDTFLHRMDEGGRVYASQASALLDDDDEILGGSSAWRGGSSMRAQTSRVGGSPRSFANRRRGDGARDTADENLDEERPGTAVRHGNEDRARSRLRDRSSAGNGSDDHFDDEDFIDDPEHYEEDDSFQSDA